MLSNIQNEAHESDLPLDRITYINAEINMIKIGLKPDVLMLVELWRDLPPVTRNNTSRDKILETEYYPLLRKTQESRKRINALQNERMNIKQQSNESSITEYSIALKENRAIKEASVTSSTYERSQRRLIKEVDGFLCGRFQ